MRAAPTPIRRLADHLLNGTLDDYVLSRRRDGVSWRRISLDLHRDTGVDVTSETLRSWYGGATDAGAA